MPEVTEIQALTAAVNRLANSRRSLWFAIAGVVIIFLAAVAGGGYLLHRESEILNCFSQYTDQSYDRSVYLQQYLIPRNEAQNDFEIAVAANAPAAVIKAKRAAFIRASNAYNSAIRNNPLPDPPRLSCRTTSTQLSPPSDSPAVTSYPPQPTKSPRPSETPSATPTAGARVQHSDSHVVVPRSQVTRRTAAPAPVKSSTRKTPSSKPPVPKPSPSSTTPPNGSLLGPALCPIIDILAPVCGD